MLCRDVLAVALNRPERQALANEKRAEFRKKPLAGLEQLDAQHKAVGKTPAIAAGLTGKCLTIADVVTLIDKLEQERIGARNGARCDQQDAVARKLSHSN